VIDPNHNFKQQLHNHHRNRHHHQMEVQSSVEKKPLGDYVKSKKTGRIYFVEKVYPYFLTDYIELRLMGVKNTTPEYALYEKTSKDKPPSDYLHTQLLFRDLEAEFEFL